MDGSMPGNMSGVGTAHLVTAAELERHPDRKRLELVAGRLVPMSPVGFEHGRIVATLIIAFGTYVRTHDLGEVITEVGFTLASNPDTVRAPDIAFIRKDRLPPERLRGFWHGAPDLAVEVLSPEDRRADVQARIDEYLACGVRVALVVDPETRTVTVYRPGQNRVVLESEDDEVALGDVMRGYGVTVGELLH